MATIQVQKTVNAKTFTKTAIDQKQSLEVVQTMLHGGVSSQLLLIHDLADTFPSSAAYRTYGMRASP